MTYESINFIDFLPLDFIDLSMNTFKEIDFISLFY